MRNYKTSPWLSWAASVLLGALPIGAGAATDAYQDCGQLANGYGPFDYRVDKSKLGIVEKFHFTREIENLRSKREVGLGSPIDYTLRAFPNHHRALTSMVNLGARTKKPKVAGATHTVECYLVRAEAFRPDDAVVKLIYGLYFLKAGEPVQALTKLELARAQRPNDANVAYNIGLAHFELGQYDQALESAHEAYALGFPLPGLKNMLTKRGKWRDPSPEGGQAATAPRTEPRSR